MGGDSDKAAAEQRMTVKLVTSMTFWTLLTDISIVHDHQFTQEELIRFKPIVVWLIDNFPSINNLINSVLEVQFIVYETLNIHNADKRAWASSEGFAP